MQPDNYTGVIHPPTIAAGRAALDELIRLGVRQELAKAGRSISDMADLFGIRQGPASRRLVNGYSWRHSDLVILGEWLGTDLVATIDSMWKAVRDGASNLGAVRPDDGGGSGDEERGPVRQGGRRRPAA